MRYANVRVGDQVLVCAKDELGKPIEEWRRIVRVTKLRVIDQKGNVWNRQGWPPGNSYPEGRLKDFKP